MTNVGTNRGGGVGYSVTTRRVMTKRITTLQFSVSCRAKNACTELANCSWWIEIGGLKAWWNGKNGRRC